MKKRKFTNLWWIGKITLILSLFILNSCDLFKIKGTDEDEEENPTVAEVDGQKLKKSELESLPTKGLSKADSSGIINRYIQSWIKKQLMIREAGKSMSFDEAELNRKLLDYKYALMVYEFEKAYLEDNIKDSIPFEEIQKYYEANKENFGLKEIIVRCNFLKMDKSSNQNPTLERLLTRPEGAEKENINEIALKFASNFYLEDSTWVRFGDIILNTPLADHPNKVGLVRNNKLIKVDDERYIYYFRILEYKLQDQIPPVEFVKNEISKILLNKKRVTLIEELQKEIYNRALENNEFKIYE
ncbi:hypothetical protein A33Q_4320 [Indibacter alkaliphilus LW1]|uniref:PpiC domain-containing protein n=1 Tax=Indibacter alkaliphilus (strain CCUG 57479 / KCTC 22604 / LW1) TaxID=1189612 RepID=S2CYI6_INDAL|nr:hypothetical protein [Indibacter alkaliphilus]EOZ92227.1 hypothetical protein A33Q_4320 [Indibacter alkaliphilus LW1]